MSDNFMKPNRLTYNKRDLIVSCFLLISFLFCTTSHAQTWTETYFRGTPNNWGATPMMFNITNGLWETQQTFSGTNPRFKISRFTNNWNEAYPAQDYTIAGGEGEYTITFNDITKAISATKLTSIPSANLICYNNPNHHTTPTIYFWNPSPVGSVTPLPNWPGQTMSQYGNFYCYNLSSLLHNDTMPASLQVIFSNSGSQQTADLTYTGAGCYENGTWKSLSACGLINASSSSSSSSNTSNSSSSSGASSSSSQVTSASSSSSSSLNIPSSLSSSSLYATSDHRICYRTPANHTQPTIYFWAPSPAGSVTPLPGWPGQAMNQSGAFSCYDFSLLLSNNLMPSSLKVIFSNSGSQQTADLTYNGTACYDNGTWKSLSACGLASSSSSNSSSVSSSSQSSSHSTISSSNSSSVSSAPPTDHRICYRHPANHTTPTIYFWNPSPAGSVTPIPTWPGRSMTRYGDFYCYDFSENLSSTQMPASMGVIFSNNGAAQTADLTYQRDAACYDNGIWKSLQQCGLIITSSSSMSVSSSSHSASQSSTSSSSSVSGRPMVANTNVCYDNPDNHANPTIFFWQPEPSDRLTVLPPWPGYAMTKQGKFYCFDFKPFLKDGYMPDSLSVIFSSNGQNQSTDLRFNNRGCFDQGTWKPLLACDFSETGSSSSASSAAPGQPLITSVPDPFAYINNPYSYTVTATAENSLIFTLLAAPTGMTINYITGAIEWHPTSNQQGEHTVSIAVTNNELTSTQTFTITVVEPSLILLPKANAQSVDLTWNDIGADSYNVYISSSSNCDVNHYALCPDGELISNITSPYRVTGLKNGKNYWFILEAMSNSAISRSPTAGARPDQLIVNNTNLYPDYATVQALATADDGTLYMGGDFTEIGIRSGHGVGINRQTGFAEAYPYVNGEIHAVVSDGAGGWYIGGTFSYVNDEPRHHLAHIRADGTLGDWAPQFSYPDSSSISALAVDKGIIYIAGRFSLIEGRVRNGLAAIDVNGTLTNWNPNTNPTYSDYSFYTLAIANDTIYVGGYFRSIGSTERMNIAAISTDGTLKNWYPSIGSYSLAPVRTLVVYNNIVYIGGNFSQVNGMDRLNLAAIDTNGALIDWNPGFYFLPSEDSFVNALAITNDTVYVGGQFHSINGIERRYLGAIGTDGSLKDWSPVVGGEFSQSNGAWPDIRSIVITDDIVYVGGRFTSINGIPRAHIAAIGMDGSLKPWNPKASNAINAMAITGNTIYAAGALALINGTPRQGLASINPDGTLNDWNPTAEANFNPVSTIAILDDTIYVGGRFTRINGTERTHLAAIKTDGTLTDWNPGVEETYWDSITSIAIVNGTIYIGGNFSRVGGQERNRLAAIGLDGSLHPWNPNANGRVWALAAEGDTLYAGGDFTLINGIERHHLAAIKTDGTISPWNPTVTGAQSRAISALDIASDRVYVGGNFTAINGINRRGLAAINHDGTMSEWAPVVTARYSTPLLINTLSVVNDTVFVGGEFESINTLPRINVAAIGTNGILNPWAPHTNAGKMTYRAPHGQIYASAISDKAVYAGTLSPRNPTSTTGGFKIFDLPKQPPAIQSTPISSTLSGITYHYQVTAEDPQHSQLNYALVNAPQGMVIDTQTGLIQWLPQPHQVGSHAVSVTVTNTFGLTATQDYTLDVEPHLYAVITPPQSPLPAGANITLDGTGSSNSHGNIAAYRWTRLPDSAVLSTETTLILTQLPVGHHQYQLEIEDSSGNTAKTQASFVVGYKPLAVAPEYAHGYAGTEIFIDGQSSSIEQGPLSYQWFIDGELISEAASFPLSLPEPGIYTLELVVTSELGLSDSRTINVEILADLHNQFACAYQPVSDDYSYIDQYPHDNIPWYGGWAESVLEIQRAFNHARLRDPSVNQYLIMPEQSIWDAMPLPQKGLYLINAERAARGLKPYSGYDAAMNQVAQSYAEYIHSNNQVIGHFNDNRTPMQRMRADTYIDAHAETFISLPESLASTTALNRPENEVYALVRAIYGWLYQDKDWFIAFGLSEGTPWGHRNQLLQTGLQDNHGDSHSEGIVGFGLARGLYRPGSTSPTTHGAVTVFKTIDQGPGWDNTRIHTVDISQAQGCLPYTLDIPEDNPWVAGLERLTIYPDSLHLATGQSSNITITGWYQDGSQRDLTALGQFIADSYSVTSVSQGQVSALHPGLARIYARVAGIESNRLLLQVGETADHSQLIGTPAESLRPYIAGNATATHFSPLAMAVFTGLVTDRYGTPLPDTKISLLHAPDYGSVTTDNDGRFIIAGPAGEQTLVYEKENHLVLQRTTIATSNSWAALETVTLLPRDTHKTWIHLNSETPQVHQSSTIIDAFGERRATIVFNGISSAIIRSADGSQRPLEQFLFSATEFETPASMPGELPTETAFTWASDLHIDGTHYTDTVQFNGQVVMYVDNFLNFPVGEIVPIGYFDRLSSRWVASSNGVVVRLLDQNGDGLVDGVDYNDDGLADDLNNNGSTLDEAIGLANYSAGTTLWWGSFTHMTPYDYNWAADDAEAPEPVDSELETEEEKDTECEATGSFFKPYRQSFHEDIRIAGTDITLHYTSQRTSGYQHKLRVAVSGNEIPVSLEKMIARLEIAGRVFEQVFDPAPNIEAEFIWDGTHPDGSRAQGLVSGRVSIGFEYQTFYLSAGNAATEDRPLENFPVAWATLSDIVTQVPGRENFIAWQQRGITIKNTYEHQIAEGWSLSSVHEFDPKGTVYLGNGEVVDVATPSLILKTGQTFSHIDKDDGYYQAGGKNIDYAISNENLLVDRVTGLEWQYLQTPFRTADKQQAIHYCQAQAEPRNTGWRLPTAKEAAYTIDKSGRGAGHIIYSLTQARNLWHQSAINTEQRELAVTCVRGTPLDETTIHELTRNANDEVVVDKANGLMWQDTPANTQLKLDWESSIHYCESLEHAGYDNWRLPNINELLYVLPNQVFTHQTSYPINTPWTITAPQRNPYWSSTTNAQHDEQAWAIESVAFNSERFSKLDNYHVRCIREDSTAARMPYRFNSKGQHTATIDMLSGATRNLLTYSDAGQISSISDQFGNTLHIERDQTGKPVRLIAPNGQTTWLAVNAQNQLTQVVYEDGSNYRFNYRDGGLLTEKIDPRNERFTRHYNDIGRLSWSSDPMGGLWQIFDERLSHKTNRYGYITAENNRHQTTRQTLENGDIQTIQITKTGAQHIQVNSADGLSETTSAYGMTTHINYVLDEKSLRPVPNQVTVTTPSGLTRITTLTKTYAENGADTSRYSLVTDSNGNTSTLQVNGRTGIHSFTSAEGRNSTTYSDPQTLLVRRIQMPGLNDTLYDYDAQGRRTETRMGSRTTAYAYDNRGNLSEVTAADGRKTSYDYDLLGRVTRVTYPDGHSTQTQYDANGNATKVIVPSFAEHDVTYNAVNLTQAETRPVQETTQYTHNRDRQLTQISLPSGEAIHYVYQQGRLDRIERPEGNTHYRYQQGDQLHEVQQGSELARYSYDGTLLTQLNYQGQLNTGIGFGYNADFRINSLSYAGANTSLNYDRDGFLVGINGYSIDYYPDHGLPQILTRGAWNKTWQWNTYGEATSVDYRYGTQQRYGYELEYNVTGQIVRKTEYLPDGSSATFDYTYDNRYRLTEVKRNNEIVEAYGYDANGNRILHTSVEMGITNQSATYTQGDQLQSHGDTTYLYDANGRLSSKLKASDDGLLLTTYVYSSQGQLLQVDTPDKSIRYLHNAPGNRVTKLVNGAVTEQYLWQDLTTLLAIYDGAGNLKQRFEYTLGHTPTSFTQNGQRYFIQTDHLGSPRVITDSSGNIVKTVSYDSYGNIIEDSNPEFQILFGFAGGLKDDDTGLIRFGYRDYDPETGRWTARDPIGFAGGDTNLYGYVLGNPINWTDIIGLARRQERPLDIPILQNTTFGPFRHDRFLYDNGIDSGYYGDGTVRADTAPQYLQDKYKDVDRWFDDNALRQAEKNIQDNGWFNDPYSANPLNSHQCQDYADAVVREYDRITNRWIDTRRGRRERNGWRQQWAQP